MRRLIRLMWYVRPYWPQLFASVVLFSLVGLLEAFRVALLGPIFNRVLAPETPGRSMPLLKIPHTSTQSIWSNWFPAISIILGRWLRCARRFRLLKGIFDYVGTYLVN